MPVPLTDDEYLLFSEWLSREVGLRFGPERREILRARLEPLRSELDLPSFERLLFHIRYHPARADARSRLLSNLTNNESYFFRESAQLDLLREEILPELGREARSEGREIRILSGGCAAGEEPYTLAIIAREVLEKAGVEVVVTGVDLDAGAIQRAREGLYRDHAFRGVDERIRRRYFSREDNGWRIRPEIRAAARFEHANLVDKEWPASMDPQDVVFCRNVMIYFDDSGVRRAVDHLFRVVRPGGCVFLGHAESLSRIPTRFVAERRAGAVFYRRPRDRS
jgi:chemotaxis protein methyltransferase CheR